METAGVHIVAEGLTVRGPRGPVFENIDLEVPAAGMLVVHGPAGSGRTSLLLTLAGRMRSAAGAVRVGDHVLPDDARAVRGLIAIARAQPAHALEGRLRVAELIAQRRWIDRVRPERIDEGLALVDIDPPRRSLVEDLGAGMAERFAVALAVAARPAAIVLDDLGAGCTPEERDQVWRTLGRVRESGITVLSSTTEPPGPQADAVSVPLPRYSVDQLPPPPAAHEERGSA